MAVVHEPDFGAARDLFATFGEATTFPVEASPPWTHVTLIPLSKQERRGPSVLDTGLSGSV